MDTLDAARAVNTVRQVRIARSGLMQRILEKMAQKLNEYDEASLMQLWQHYAVQVQDFEPTKRWEEAALVLCMIQAIHWKNQLFNYHLAQTANPGDGDALPGAPEFFTSADLRRPGKKQPGKAEKKATILSFPGKQTTPSSKTESGTGKPAPRKDDA